MNISTNSPKRDEKYFRVLISYWGSLIDKLSRLENGEIFDMDNFYNPEKYLKYPIKEIQNALLWSACFISNGDKLFLSSCEVGYMYTACFSNTDVKDKIVTRMSRVSKIIGENQTSKKKNLIEEVVDAIEIDDGKTTDLLMKYKFNLMNQYKQLYETAIHATKLKKD